MKKVLVLLLLIFSSLAVFSSDLIIDSKTQTFSDKEKKIKLDNLEERPYESGAGEIDRDRKNNNKRSGS